MASFSNRQGYQGTGLGSSFPSAIPVATADQPTVTLNIVFNPNSSGGATAVDGIPGPMSITLRRKGPFGPHLMHYCRTFGQRLNIEWEFRYYWSSSTDEDPGNDAGQQIRWEYTPATFDDVDEGRARMEDGAVIECTVRNVVVEGVLRAEEAEGDDGEELQRVKAEHARLATENEELRKEIAELRGGKSRATEKE
ncbi:hypothetical protein BCR34DRAFT_604608 [Clohesyomyces aquaticus]|uniref:Uncharacterized protein n=1 Tax=Clohesyomyces aquaticus TaxID=1231657 RepID=A0A1Y1Z5B4_9PLEO|nr:hypothetical protein BCR34DRAFT_604608 [Clohesyomyces aquaticus]